MKRSQILLIGLGGCLFLKGIHHFLFPFPDWGVRALGMSMMVLSVLLVSKICVEKRKAVSENK